MAWGQTRTRHPVRGLARTQVKGIEVIGMKQIAVMAGTVLIAALLTGASAQALQPVGDGHMGPGQGMGQGQGMGPGQGQGQGMGPGMGPGMQQGMQPFSRPLMGLGPGGRWWNMPWAARQLGLTDQQREAMDQIFQQHRLNLVDLRGNLQKAEIELEPLISTDQPQDARILAQIDRVAQARAELEKANARMLLDIRHQLTPEQWMKLRAFMEKRRERMAGGQGQNGQGQNRGGQFGSQANLPPAGPEQGPGNGPGTGPMPQGGAGSTPPQ